MAFVDLKAAFNLVQRALLWGRLRSMGVSPPILEALVALHTDIYAQIQWGTKEELTHQVPINRGVWLGCVLAPTLFSLFVNNVGAHLLKCSHDCPSVGGLETPIVMFADDSIII